MGDLKVFRIHGDAVSELPGHSVAVEKSLQTLIEHHLDTFLGVRFLASEHSTGPLHAGRIDTPGIEDSGGMSAREARRFSELGTGDLEITIASDADLEKAKTLLVRSYEAS
jgi:hypothetical protein